MEMDFDDFENVEESIPLPVPEAMKASQEQESPPPGEPSEDPHPVVHMAHFAPGMTVNYMGRARTVSYVVLRGGDLRVKLVEEEKDVLATALEAPIKAFRLVRQ